MSTSASSGEAESLEESIEESENYLSFGCKLLDVEKYGKGVKTADLKFSWNYDGSGLNEVYSVSLKSVDGENVEYLVEKGDEERFGIKYKSPVEDPERFVEDILDILGLSTHDLLESSSNQ